MPNISDINEDAPKIRTVLSERDPDTDAQCVLDIMVTPVPSRERLATWTALCADKDPARRTLLLNLSRQIDDLVSGRVHEITIVMDS